MIQRTPRSTRTHTLIPSTTLFRSRPDHDPHAIDRHGPPMSGRWVYVQHDCLRQLHDECTGHALEQPKRYHLGQGCGDAARHGCNDETDNGKEKEGARSHSVSKPARNRNSSGGCTDMPERKSVVEGKSV